jgi:hypothetical protein
LGDLLKGDFGDKGRAKSRLDDMTAHFMEWAAPELDAAHLKDEQRAEYEAIYRDLAYRLATAYSELKIKIRLPENHSPADLVNLREDVGGAMTELYLRLSGVAVIALRRALMASVGANSASIRPPP